MNAVDTPPATAPAADLLALEWLETDGLGGYAAGTAPLCPTRRYHGLLVAPVGHAAERFVYLSRFDEVVRRGTGEGDPLAVARYGDEYAPRGDRALVAFAHAPWPTWTYDLGGARLVREVRMARGRHAVLVRYTLEGSETARALVLRPLLHYRDADALTVANDAADTSAELLVDGVRCRPYDGFPALAIRTSAPSDFQADATWYRGLAYEVDAARGFDGGEDQLSPGALTVTLAPGEAVVVAASLDEPVDDPAGLWAAQGDGRSEADLDARLDRAADDFLYRDATGRRGVLAGFPWFGEWGRDTFLALPGLTLSRGDLAGCAEVLTGAAPLLRGGLLPNIFGATPEDSHYGSADAALWFARAALLYDRAGGKRKVLTKTLYPALASIAEAYLEGAELGMRFDEEGLLRAGLPEKNPTWMDAQVGGVPVTPRHGCPVEVAALGCSLVAHLEELAPKKAERARWTELRKRQKKAFPRRFWLEEEGHLADNWRDGEPDRAVRPNMVLAAALELAPLTKWQRAAVVAKAEAELLTPFGLRTLAPGEAGYVGTYGGGPAERDGAYHQGTVWPWLMGAYTEAALRAARPTKARLAELAARWDALVPELDRVGLDHVSEVYSGDAPHAPGGTFAQAWNTAEWLRARAMLAAGSA